MVINLSGCAIVDEEKLLLLWKIKHKHYEFPGGKVQEGESLEDTARRETKEEIGCQVQIIKYLGYSDFTFAGKELRSHKFLADLQQDCTPRVMEPDSFSKLLWMPIKEYKNYDIAPNVQHFCREYLAGSYK